LISSGRQPVLNDTKKLQTDPHWRDNLRFDEYYHRDTGTGLGRSHQTGRTGLVAKLIQSFGTLDAPTFPEASKQH
jgi:hypothetical protein